MAHAGRPRFIWGAEAIARRIGTSSDFVRDTLAKIEGSPVRKIGHRYCAIEGELIDYFSSRPKTPVKPT
ncbi:MAG: hypothetical protein AB7O60_03250 [Variibacter sp.]